MEDVRAAPGVGCARVRITTRVCSVVSDSATPLTVAHQAPLSMGFLGEEYWSELPFPSPEGDNLPRRKVNFLTEGSNLCLLHWQVGSLPLSHQGNPICIYYQRFI